MTLENPPFSIGKSHLHSWWLFQPVMLGEKKSHFPGLFCPRLWVLEFLRDFIAVVAAILTLLKTNITPESGWLEDDSSYYGEGLFSGDMLGSQRAKFILQNACLTCFLGEDVGMSRDKPSVKKLGPWKHVEKQSSNDRKSWLFRVYSGLYCSVMWGLFMIIS